MTLIKIIILAFVLVVTITFFALYKNNANLFEAPGLINRLQIFLKTNSAKTSTEHKLKELQTPYFNMSVEELDEQMLKAASALGWQVFSHDSEKFNANFVAYSDVFLFEDDIYVQVQRIDQNQSSLYIESHSRVGRADFAANSSHIQALINKLR